MKKNSGIFIIIIQNGVCYLVILSFLEIENNSKWRDEKKNILIVFAIIQGLVCLVKVHCYTIDQNS